MRLSSGQRMAKSSVIHNAGVAIIVMSRRHDCLWQTIRTAQNSSCTRHNFVVGGGLKRVFRYASSLGLHNHQFIIHVLHNFLKVSSSSRS